MPGRIRLVLLFAAASAALLGACMIQPASAPIAVLKSANPMLVELGRRLFYDADLSIDGTMSCATCHEQKKGFADGTETHPGVRGDAGERNVMALANVGMYRSLTWGGPQVDTLEHQALLPIQGMTPIEMGFGGRNDDALPARLRDQACYPQLFKAAFPERHGEISLDTISAALAEFQRTLVSVDSPWDRYKAGKLADYPEAAKRGEAAFNALQCQSCHAGTYFTDAAEPGVKIADTFHALNPLKPGDAMPKDPGMSRVTGRREDANRFRTPSLRNVSLSAPYLHDGAAKTLEDAIRFHFAAAGRQSDARLKTAPSDAQMADLVAFLKTLTDETFIHDPRFALPKPGCPVALDDAGVKQLRDEQQPLHNELPGP
ncbi:MAG TPA: cytochrome c peroxidase [Hyphomonadaceae bacterium]|nr:cytochrome c peroxidase [Hyphomonadaceae bacterium]